VIYKYIINRRVFPNWFSTFEGKISTLVLLSRKLISISFTKRF
jgi:hypothetical protein